MTDGDIMLYVGGSNRAFRCECGSNVFHKISLEEKQRYGTIGGRTYECNGCKAWYTEAVEEEQE